MDTNLYKNGRDGWQASTSLSMESQRELQIFTRRNNHGQLTTSATVWHLRSDGTRTHAMGLGTTGGDFSCRVLETRPLKITEKAVAAQHDKVLLQVDAIMERARQHYAAADAIAEAKSETAAETV